MPSAVHRVNRAIVRHYLRPRRREDLARLFVRLPQVMRRASAVACTLRPPRLLPLTLHIPSRCSHQSLLMAQWL